MHFVKKALSAGALWLGIGLMVVVAIASASCLGLRLRLVNSSVQRPSNVALYFSVERRNGEPVAGLEAKKFKIYEDDQLISHFESKQTILNPDVAVSHHILLLLDLSGSVTKSGQLPALVEAANTFADKVSKKHPVAIYGFDGRTRLIPIAGFTKDPATVKSALDRLSEHKTKDPSTNLNGAVVKAVDVLEKKMARASQPLRFGTMVVFTDGTDRAHRVPAKDMFERLKQSSVNVFVIGLGAEISEDQLNKLGRDGFVKATDKSAIKKAFDQVAAGIEAAGRKFYLLSYCSPSRAGKHKIRVEVEFEGKRGELQLGFDAKGFRPKCDPKKKPSFSLKKVSFREP